MPSILVYFAVFSVAAGAGNLRGRDGVRRNTKAQQLDNGKLLQEKSVQEQHLGRVLQAGVPGKIGRIPSQLILTGKYATKDDWPRDVSENMKKAFEKNPDLQVRWFSDNDCGQYLKTHKELGLHDAFEREHRGSYRGDICRTAILSREGGFYQDLDVELLVPFRQLVDNKTSFMSVYSGSGGILNALFATEPKGSVVQHTLQELQRWYNVPGAKDGNWMGPETMERGLKAVTEKKCPQLDKYAKRQHLQWNCGEDGIRLYQEKKLQNCDYNSYAGAGCTLRRALSGFDGLKFGLFNPTTSDVIGWPRYEKCPNFGCAIGGWDVS